jgi:hypothetical protein
MCTVVHRRSPALRKSYRARGGAWSPVRRDAVRPVAPAEWGDRGRRHVDVFGELLGAASRLADQLPTIDEDTR